MSKTDEPSERSVSKETRLWSLRCYSDRMVYAPPIHIVPHPNRKYTEMSRFILTAGLVFMRYRMRQAAQSRSSNPVSLKKSSNDLLSVTHIIRKTRNDVSVWIRTTKRREYPYVSLPVPVILRLL